MRYLLTILTNGRQTCLERALHAFAQHVDPLPAEVFVMDDGGQTGGAFIQATLAATLPGVPYAWEDSFVPLGMCRAHAHCWHAAKATELPWVFHLEDDLVVLRPLDLEAIAATLDAQPHLAQMALVRAPWGFEIEHGGYIPQTPGHYERRGMNFGRCEDSAPAEEFAGGSRPEAEWIETTRNYATNPALFRSDLAREFPWPLDGGCETLIGPAIIEGRGPDTRFGLWGWGEPWAAHVGVERHPGSFGYH